MQSWLTWCCWCRGYRDPRHRPAAGDGDSFKWLGPAQRGQRRQGRQRRLGGRGWKQSNSDNNYELVVKTHGEYSASLDESWRLADRRESGLTERASWGNCLSTFQDILSQSNYSQNPLQVNIKYLWYNEHNEWNSSNTMNYIQCML